MLERLTPEVLTGHRFASWSLVYPALPTDGYPLEFNRDGTIRSSQFGHMTWSVDNGDLVMRFDRANVTTKYTFHRDCHSLASNLELGGAVVLMEIAIVE